MFVCVCYKLWCITVGESSFIITQMLVSMVTRQLIGVMGVFVLLFKERANYANNRGTRPAASGRAQLNWSSQRVTPPWFHAPQHPLLIIKMLFVTSYNLHDIYCAILRSLHCLILQTNCLLNRKIESSRIITNALIRAL